MKIPTAAFLRALNTGAAPSTTIIRHLTKPPNRIFFPAAPPFRRYSVNVSHAVAKAGVMQPKHLRRISAIVVGSLLMASSAVFAQNATGPDQNTPANNSPPAPPPQASVAPPGGTRINNQVGGELYGNQKQSGPLYTPQVQPLPSETRMAIERSGALPSEILINSQAAGPLSPHGAIDYVPDQSTVQRAMGAKPLNLWGPAYGPSLQQPQTGPGAPMLQYGSLSASSTGAFNPTTPGVTNRSPGSAANVPAASPLYVNRYIQPQVVNSGYLVQPLGSYTRALPSETTTTTIIIHPIPTTQPTTQSLGNEH